VGRGQYLRLLSESKPVLRGDCRGVLDPNMHDYVCGAQVRLTDPILTTTERLFPVSHMNGQTATDAPFRSLRRLTLIM
jgi:hypothetical protein